MTKCSPNQCRSKTSFFYKVLVSIKQLLSTRKFCNGVTQAEIAKFMEKNNCLSGDITSQLENALCVAVTSRFVTKRKNLYLLISPAANIHLIPEACVKNKLDEIQKSFDAAQCPVDNICASSTRQSSKNHSQNAARKPPSCCRKRASRTTSRSRSRSRSKSGSRSQSRSASPCSSWARHRKRRKRDDGPCSPQPKNSQSGLESPARKPSKSCMKKSRCNEFLNKGDSDRSRNNNVGKCGSDIDSFGK